MTIQMKRFRNLKQSCIYLMGILNIEQTRRGLAVPPVLALLAAQRFYATATMGIGRIGEDVPDNGWPKHSSNDKDPWGFASSGY